MKNGHRPAFRGLTGGRYVSPAGAEAPVGQVMFATKKPATGGALRGLSPLYPTLLSEAVQCLGTM